MRQLFQLLGLAISSVTLISTVSATDIPTGQLPTSVEPTHYDLEIKLDPENERFSGLATIDIVAHKSLPYFYMHGQELKVDQTWLMSGNKKIPATTEMTKVEGVIKIIPKEVLKKGEYEVSFEYNAPFNENLQGLYRVKDGDQHYAYTQMESIYARYAFPSFDEPRFKTKFDLDLIVPEKLTAIANTPEVKTETLNNGWKKVSFVTSKPMPTYLWAIAVGEFDVVEWTAIPKNDVRDFTIPLRGIATKGKGEKLKYALENTEAVLYSLEDYFQSAYPYRKLDILAVPDFAAGAMENPGAITYREQLLLLDENASIGQKRRYMSVHAHELAHQWFGNLVTPVWWNDIWLNEAFATWMAATALDRHFPDQQWRRSQSRSSKNAMNADSIPSARKVRNPIETNGDIITAFDGITYSKGGGVLSMIESFMGEENFRKGVQKYMDKYAWKNADAIDFFETIASVLEPKRADKVVASFRNFVEQAGVPLLDIDKTCDDERTVLNITQERYAPVGTEFKEKTLWNIPVCMSYEVDGEVSQQCQVIAEAHQKVKLEMSGCAEWVMPNVAAAGYYRFNFDSEGWKDLIANLNKVSAEEANAVIDSMSAAFGSGTLKVKELVDVIPTTLQSDSWEVMVSGMGTLGTLVSYADEKDKPLFRKMAGDIYRDAANNLGLDNNTEFDKTKPLDATQLRTRLVSFMANTAEDAAVRKTLTEKAKDYVGYKGDKQFHDEAIIPSLRSTAMGVAVQELGQPYVDFLIEKLSTINDGTLRGRIISALTATKDPEIAKQLIELSLSPAVRDNEKPSFLFGLMGKKELDAVMWPWLQNNFDKLITGLPSNYQAFAPYLFMGECKQEKAERLDGFLKPRLDKLIGADRNFVKAKEYLNQCLAQKEQVKPQIADMVKTMR
ncbi:M1 family metallopeptidase [Pleionea sediminis]|uniref:M1 family metallopeptidase n=1 Tax=Pleionea sediminis TaxID=2569479 RepID=UPI00118666A6|nr:M1 family metallopeptidase [Pleionea sediminis]